MVKLSLSSWLGSSSSSTTKMAAADAERKRENRRSFAGFSTVSSQFSNKAGSRLSTTLPRAKKSSNTPPNVAAADKNVVAKHADRASSLGGSTTNTESDVAAATTPSIAQAGVQTSSAGSTMTELAATISRETAKLEKFMRDNNLPMPSFEVSAADDFPKLPEDIQQSRLAVIHATKELRDLTVGPRESVRWGVWEFLDVLALQLVNAYNLAGLVPLDHPIALTELAGLTPLDSVNLARVLRTAMTNHIFAEPSPGMIAHTAASRLLATDPELCAWVGFNGEDILPAAAHVLPQLRAHPEATHLCRAGFQGAFGTDEPMFATFGRDANRAKRMGRAMVSLTGGEGYEVDYFVKACDLSAEDARGATFVDVGGSHGFVCVDLARRWKGMKFVVQDLPKTVDSAPVPVDGDDQVARRIEFEPHDFFTEQKRVGDIYYFRWIMHNYSTPYAVSILRNLVPALKPGARIIINDHCLRDPGLENPWDEKIMRRMDMVMLALLNAQERTEAEFKALFREASEGFVFKGVTRPKGCRMSIIEAVWKPDEVVGEMSGTTAAPEATDASA